MGGLVLQAWCFRWYNCLGAILGLCFILLGLRGVRSESAPLLNAFVAIQLMLSILILVGAIFTFRAIEFYNSDSSYCGSELIYYLGAVFSPLALVAVLLAAIYARRAWNLIQDSASTPSWGVPSASEDPRPDEQLIRPS